MQGEDLRIHKEGNSQSYCEVHSLSFLCPHCGQITYVHLEDKELEEYIEWVFPPVYYGDDGI